jgi:WD40 repeat protein
MIQVWNPAAGELLYTLEGNSHSTLSFNGLHPFEKEDIGAVQSITFSPNSKLLASSCSSMIQLWDLVTCELLQVLEDVNGMSVLSVTFSSDSKMLASCCWSKINLWDPATGKLLQTLDTPPTFFLPTGEWIRTPTLEPTPKPTFSAAFSPNSKLLVSATSTHGIALWDPVTGKRLRTFGYDDSISCVAVSPDNKLIASGSGFGKVQLWDAETGKLLQVLEGHSRGIHSITFSTDNKLLISGAYDSTIRLWDLVESEDDSEDEGRTSKLLRGFRNLSHRSSFVSPSFGKKMI